MMRVAEQQRIETLTRMHRDHYSPQHCEICLLLKMIEEQKRLNRRLKSNNE